MDDLRIWKQIKKIGFRSVAKKQNVLLCWIGDNDLKAPSGVNDGPVLSTLSVVVN